MNLTHYYAFYVDEHMTAHPSFATVYNAIVENVCARAQGVYNESHSTATKIIGLYHYTYVLGTTPRVREF